MAQKLSRFLLKGSTVTVQQQCRDCIESYCASSLLLLRRGLSDNIYSYCHTFCESGTGSVETEDSQWRDLTLAPALRPIGVKLS